MYVQYENNDNWGILSNVAASALKNILWEGKRISFSWHNSINLHYHSNSVSLCSKNALGLPFIAQWKTALLVGFRWPLHFRLYVFALSAGIIQNHLLKVNSSFHKMLLLNVSSEPLMNTLLMLLYKTTQHSFSHL